MGESSSELFRLITDALELVLEFGQRQASLYVRTPLLCEVVI